MLKVNAFSNSRSFWLLLYLVPLRLTCLEPSLAKVRWQIRQTCLLNTVLKVLPRCQVHVGWAVDPATAQTACCHSQLLYKYWHMLLCPENFTRLKLKNWVAVFGPADFDPGKLHSTLLRLSMTADRRYKYLVVPQWLPWQRASWSGLTGCTGLLDIIG
jgi:hypothetical protein